MTYELVHHGVKGMKWGVRRYQNYDGTYTKRGLARYRGAEADYERSKANAKKARLSYKSGTATKQQYKDAKGQVKLNKRKLNKAYDRLKTDKLADEGKKLYQQGKTISTNQRSFAIRQGAVVIGGNVVSGILANSGNLRLASISGHTISVGGSVINAMMAMKTNYDNKKLRAYYSH